MESKRRLIKGIEMTFLPIVTREILLASKKPMTYWARFIIALIALFYGCFTVFLDLFVGVKDWSLFSLLVYGGVWYCVFAGVRHSCDSISSEKREGTLGLLFLTDLKGYDIAFGKLAASGLVIFYSYMAVFPIMAVGLVMGGVTGIQLFCSVLALMNLLFVSLSTALLSSSFNVKYQSSFRSGLLILGFLILGTSFLSRLAGRFGFSIVQLLVNYINPMYPVYLSTDSMGGAYSFWKVLLVSHLVGWLFLAITSWRLPRCWQDRPVSMKSRCRDWIKNFTYGNSEWRNKHRRSLLDKNPAYWLNSRSRFSPWLIGGTLLMTVFFCLWLLIKISGGFGELDTLALIMLCFVELMILIGICSTAESFLSEARRDGSLEFLFSSTPLAVNSLIKAQWLKIKRLFLWPVVVLLFFHIVLIALTCVRPSLGISWFGPVYALVLFLTGLACMPWVSMWSGFISNRRGNGTGSAFIRCLAGPWFLNAILCVLVKVNILLSDLSWRQYLLGFLLIYILANVLFARNAYSHLKNDMRLVASMTYWNPIGFWARLGHFFGTRLGQLMYLKK
jgi:hypothetical protein